MSNNIIEGLFGPQLWQIQQQRDQQQILSALEYAKMSPFDRAAAGMHLAGARIGDIGARMMGYELPEVTRAKQQQAIMMDGGLDMTPESIFAKAEKFAEMGDLNTAFRLYQYGQELQATQNKNRLAEIKAVAELERARAQASLAEMRARAGNTASQGGQLKTVDAMKYMTPLLKHIYALRDEKLTPEERRFIMRAIEAELTKNDKAARGSGGGGGVKAQKPLTPAQELAREKLNDARRDAIEKALAKHATARANFNELRSIIADLVGAPSTTNLSEYIRWQKEKAKRKIDPGTGSIEGHDKYPAFLFKNATNNRVLIEKIKNIIEALGTIEMKNTGVSAGPMALQEWPKLGALIGGLSQKASEDLIIRDLLRLLDRIDKIEGEFPETEQKLRERLLEITGGGEPASTNNTPKQPAKPATPKQPAKPPRWEVVR